MAIFSTRVGAVVILNVLHHAPVLVRKVKLNRKLAALMNIYGIDKFYENGAFKRRDVSEL